MSGIYCPRCKTNIRIESDGKSCSNCGGQIIGAAKPPTLASTEKRGRATGAREAHNLEAAGSTPAPATKTIPELNAAADAERKAAATQPQVHTNGRHPTAPKPNAKPAKTARKTPADKPKSVSKTKPVTAGKKR